MGRDTDSSELHDTTQADPTGGDSGLPPAVANGLPDEYQDYSLADDASNATVSSSDTYQETLVDERAEEIYVLEMCDITWQQTNQALSNNLKQEGNTGKLDFGGYYRDVAAKKIVSVQPEVPEESLVQWLTGLNERLGKQLEQHLPDPVADIEDDTEKN